jgi:hypothetical protein
MRYNRMETADPRDAAIENLRGMVTAQSALILGLLTVLGESRVMPRAEVRSVIETALDMVDNVDLGGVGQRPRGVQSARLWLQQMLDDMPESWAA